MKKIIVLFSAVALFFGLSFTTVLGQSPEPTTVPNDSSDEAIQQNLKDRLQKVIEEKSERIQGVMDSDQNRRGFIGIVRRVSEEALTLDTPRGPVVLTLSPEVEFWEKDKTIARTAIEIANEVVVIGSQQNDEFLPARIYLSRTSLRPATRIIVMGSLKEVTRNSITITARTGEENIFAFTNQTTFTNSEGEEIKSADFEVDQDVLLIALPEDETNQTAQNSNGRIKLMRALGTIQTEE